MQPKQQPRSPLGRFVNRRHTMPVQVRMTASLRLRIDEYAAIHALDRADAIRRLLLLSLRRAKRKRP